MKRLHAITLAAASVCLIISAGRAHAGVYTVSVPAFEGVRYTYGDPELAGIVDFGRAFSQIDKITVAITGTGHTGEGLIFGGALGGTTVPLNAEVLVSTRNEYVGSQTLRGAFFGAIGTFGDTPSTQEGTEDRDFETLLSGKAELGLTANYVEIIDGTLFPSDPPYVDIQSFTVTVEGEPFTLVSDPTNDGFVGIEDLNLVLGGWGQTVAPGDIQAGDLDGDGFVGIKDLNQVLGNWNAGTPPAAATPVPEPATATALAMLVSVPLYRRPLRMRLRSA